VDQEISYTISIEEFTNFLKGRTVMGEVEGFETPDGLGWGIELGPAVKGMKTKVLFVSKWSADEDELPSISGNAPQLARKPIIWVYEKPQYTHDCTTCKFLGTYHHFDQMICEYKIIDLYVCDKTANTDANITHHQSEGGDCPTFLGRIGPGNGNYYYGHNFSYAEQDPVLKEGVARATSKGLFDKANYPELVAPVRNAFTVGSFVSFGTIVDAPEPLDGFGQIQIDAGAQAALHGIQGIPAQYIPPPFVPVEVEEDYGPGYDDDGNLI